MFAQLPEDYRTGWCNAFRVAIDEYKQWATSRLGMLEEVAGGKDIYELPGIASDIRTLIQPAF